MANNVTAREVKLGGAVFLTGLHAGAQCFISAVSVRTLVGAASKGDDALVRKFFPLWWPYGMMPVRRHMYASKNLYALHRSGYNAAAGCGLDLGQPHRVRRGQWRHIF